MALRLIQDLAANDSNKTFTVSTGRVWKMLYAEVHLTSTATVGNRQVVMIISDGTNDIAHMSAGNVQTASNTYHYLFNQGTYRETTITDGVLYVPIPVDFYLLGGYTIQVLDSAAVAATADDMLVNIMIEDFSPSDVRRI